ASLTKIMTALVAIEGTSNRDVVTVSERAVAQGGAELGLQVGEKIEVRELLYALLLQSANDAAVALAEQVAGSVEDFVFLMNIKGAEIGLTGTIFQSPTGLDDSGISTATDLARLTIAASRKALFRRIVDTKFYEIPSPEGEPRTIQNRNVLLWLYQGATGGKTGFTSAAGHSVVATAERDGLRLVAVVLGAPGEAFSGAASLLNFGFSTFERRRVIESGERFQVLVLGLPVAVAAVRGLEALVKRTEDLDVRIVVREGIRFPLAQGERVGKAVVSRAGERLGTVPLVTAAESTLETMAVRSWLRAAWDVISAAFGWLIGLFS
ncbi:MAG: D-alanyl-D-alanine carboxypeptidase family protein, partial [Actinomycetota bacterium]